jgi:hypothetical protein
MDDWDGHLRVRIQWYEARLNWSATVSFGTTLELFGRQWHIAQLEQDAEHLGNLVFNRVLPMRERAVSVLPGLRRARPAAIDLAWAGLENALAAASAARSRESIEQPRHTELIPLGRAIYGLLESSGNRRLRTPQEIANRTRAVAFHAAELEPTLGRVPWRILPEQVRGVLLRPGLYSRASADLQRIFDGLPATQSAALAQGLQYRPFQPLAKAFIAGRLIGSAKAANPRRHTNQEPAIQAKRVAVRFARVKKDRKGREPAAPYKPGTRHSGKAGRGPFCASQKRPHRPRTRASDRPGTYGQADRPRSVFGRVP